MTSSINEQVREFHRVYEHPIADKPQIPAEDRLRLRLKLIKEEFIELMRSCLAENSNVNFADMMLESAINAAYIAPDMVEIADALGDLDYVIEGMRLELGIDGEPVADEIHRSNLSKLGEDGKPLKREDGKVAKGPNYTPPDIARVLREQGWQK